MLLIYIDIILLLILVSLTIVTFCFCIYQMNRLHKRGRVTILVDPRHVFRDKHGENQRLHTVVSTPPAPARAPPRSPDSAHSAAYEPLDPPPLLAAYSDTRMALASRCASAPPESPSQYNRITRSWNWNYKEYQI